MRNLHLIHICASVTRSSLGVQMDSLKKSITDQVHRNKDQVHFEADGWTFRRLPHFPTHILRKLLSCVPSEFKSFDLHICMAIVYGWVASCIPVLLSLSGCIIYLLSNNGSLKDFLVVWSICR